MFASQPPIESTDSPPGEPALTRADVVAAAERLCGYVRPTPALHVEALDELAGAELWLKAENMQYMGAFKARGAMHATMRLSEAERKKGLITYSSGNHAQAVALAAHRFGVPAIIAMPEDAPQVKVDAVRGLGARIEFAGTTSLHRKKRAFELQAETGGAIIEPFDHPDIIAGQGTATLELLAEVQERTGSALDALIVPVGGGGLIAGACLACEGTDVHIYSAEPVTCNALARSLAAGERVPVEPGPTIADGLKPTLIGERNFAVAKSRVAGSYTVSDEEIARALVTLLVRGRVLVEPSGAAALAVALRGQLPGQPPEESNDRRQRVGVILSGGNLAPALVSELICKYAADVKPWQPDQN